MRPARLLLLVALLCSAAAFAENAIVLDGATIIHGNGEITPNGRVVVSGRKIVYAGPREGSAAAGSPVAAGAPAGSSTVGDAEVIDLSSCFILPGFIDSDVHLDGYPYIDQWISSGITTIVDVGTSMESAIWPGCSHQRKDDRRGRRIPLRLHRF